MGAGCAAWPWSLTARGAAACLWLQARQRYKVASKYMAILSLAAMDPSKRNRQQAQQDLHSFVCRRRRHMGDAATAAAFASGGGGVTVPDQPDFILPYVVFLLAHHPDFPEVRSPAPPPAVSAHAAGPPHDPVGTPCPRRRRTISRPVGPRSWTPGRR